MTGADEGAAGLTVHGVDAPPDVTLSDLALSGNGSGVGLEVDSATVTLAFGDVSSNDSDGILVTGAGVLNVTGSTINSNGGDGLTTGTDSSPTVNVAATDVSHNGGVGIRQGDGVAVVTASRVASNGGGGIVTAGSVTVDGSAMDANVGAGVVAEDGER